MFKIFFFVLLTESGLHLPLDVGYIPTFDTLDECNIVGEKVVDQFTNDALEVGKLLWVCIEREERD